MIVLVLCEVTTGMAKERVDKKRNGWCSIGSWDTHMMYARGFRSTSIRVVSGVEIGRCAMSYHWVSGSMMEWNRSDRVRCIYAPRSCIYASRLSIGSFVLPVGCSGEVYRPYTVVSNVCE